MLSASSRFIQSSAMEHCEDIITVIDANLNYTDFNKAFLNVLGRKKPSEIMKKHIKDVLPQESCPIVESELKTVLETGEAQTYTYRLINNDKIIRQISTPIKENGKITSVLSIARDVTQEENLTLKLMEKVCRFNTLLEHIPMLIYMKDLDGKYITGSKCAKDFIDYGFDSYENLQLIFEDITENYIQDDSIVFETMKTVTKEMSLKSIDGNEHWYKIYKAPIFDNNENLNSIITIAKNIDFEKQVDRQKELFLATLTHDLKNPLQAQIMTMKMLYNGGFGELNESQKETLGLVIESANYMQDMLYSILTTYKFENGIIKLEKEEFSVDKLMQVCIKEVSAHAKDKNIKFVYKLNAKTDKIFADEHQLRRVISNIINNSINYAYRDTEIKITISSSEDKMVFDFENTSDVIPEEIKENIFDKYVSGAQAYKKQGIGLGLYFCRKVVEAHNGEIYVEGRGNANKFTFEIPVSNTSQSEINW